jgi:ABC-type sulfate/molybdate transport systems ATPase subunit
VLGGLWPLAKGKIGKPGRDKQGGLSHDIFYVPQRPYVTVGTLQEQLTYPLSGGKLKLEGAPLTLRQPTNAHFPSAGESKIEEHQLRILLKSVDLEYLIDRTGSAQEVVDWEEVLSLGEQQRLGMARLFFHKPNFAILDECTSGVTVSMEQRFCEMVKDMGCTCITISHRPALMAFHDLVLNLDGEGGWSIHQGARSQPSSTDKDSANKMRGLDSDAVLKGMTSVQMAVGEENYGEIVSRSPGSVTAQIKEWNPKQLLMPAAKSPLVRWKVRAITTTSPSTCTFVTNPILYVFLYCRQYY